MGLFDTVYVNSDVASTFDLKCGHCGRIAPADHEWQTKSLDPGMVSYLLRHDDRGAVRLYLLDRPTDKRFWRAWSSEEIEESERDAARGGVFALWVKRPGEGTFVAEAYLPQNRRQRSMGELPHQWVEIYGRCVCGEHMEWWIKFCDGIVGGVRDKPPMHEPGFFDDAGELMP
jgi:hypothetical protein